MGEPGTVLTRFGDVAAAGGVQPDFVEDFESYTDIANFLTDPNGWYTGFVSSSDMSFGPGLDVDGYNLTRALTYTWPNNGVNCLDYSITSQIGFVEALGAVQDEIWMELYIKFSSNFKTNWTAGGCNPDYKLFATDYLGAGTTGPSGRWGVKTGTFGDETVNVGSPNDVVADDTSEVGTLWDGNWHKFRNHVRRDTGSNNGHHALDVDDGALSCSVTDLDTEADQLYKMRMGMNMNQGPDADGVSVSWGRTAIYTTDPGWGI